MDSGFVLIEENELGFPVALATGLATTGINAIKKGDSVKAGIIGGPISAFASIFGGKDSLSEKNKKQIKEDLRRLGYGELGSKNNMHGWKGNEKQKEMAMRTILIAVNEYPSAASMIRGWMENGKVTPNTIMKVKARYPEKGNYKVELKQSKSGSKSNVGNIINQAASAIGKSGGNGSNANVPATTTPQSQGGINPMYLYAGGGLLLVGLGIAALKG